MPEPGCSLTDWAVDEGHRVSAEELHLFLNSLRSQLTSVDQEDSLDDNMRASMLIGITPS